MANTLFLRLEGPLQAWGERGRWSIRDTAPEPTKSGVIGLLACALGLWEDSDLRMLSDALSLGVRCDRPGVNLRDYHTVVGGVLSADGKVKRNASTGKPETVVSERHYLADASFLVAVQSSDRNLIDRLADAVQNPHWPIFLGRKSCPPSLAPYSGMGDFPDLISALRAHATPAEVGHSPAGPVRIVVEAPNGTRRRDVVRSRRLRTYGYRHTREIWLVADSLEV